MKFKKRRTLTFSIVVAVSIIFSTLSANVLADSWIKIYGTAPIGGNGGSDAANDIASDDNGNFYITGVYNSHLSCGWDTCHVYDVIVAKLDSDGNIVWQDILSSGPQGSIIGNDEGIAIETDGAGNSYVLGKTSGDISGEGIVPNPSYFITKYNTVGVKQWIHQFGSVGENGTGFEQLYDLALDSNGNSYIVGSSMTAINGRGYFDAIVYKYDTNGNQVSFNLYSSADSDEAAAAVVDSNDNLYVTGWKADPNGGYGNAYDTWIKKFSPNGTLLWSSISGVIGWDRPGGIAFSKKYDELVVVGNAQDIPFVFRVSAANGAMLSSVNGTAYRYYGAVDTDDNGDIYITGRFGKNAVVAGNWGSDILLAKFFSDGTFNTDSYIGTFGTRDPGNGIVVNANGDYVIAGGVAGDLNGVVSNDASITSLDIVILKNLPN